MNSVMRNRPVLDITTRAAKVQIRRRRPQFKVRHSSPKMMVRKKTPTFRKKRLVTPRGRKAPVVQLSKRFIRQPLTHISKVSNILTKENDTLINNEENKNLVSTMMEEPIETVIPKAEVSVIPDEMIQLEWDKGYFDIEWTRDILEIEWDVDMVPEITVEPHAVEIRVRNYDGSTKSRVSRKLLNKSVGVKVDKKV